MGTVSRCWVPKVFAAGRACGESLAGGLRVLCLPVAFLRRDTLRTEPPGDRNCFPAVRHTEGARRKRAEDMADTVKAGTFCPAFGGFVRKARCAAHRSSCEALQRGSGRVPTPRARPLPVFHEWGRDSHVVGGREELQPRIFYTGLASEVWSGQTGISRKGTTGPGPLPLWSVPSRLHPNAGILRYLIKIINQSCESPRPRRHSSEKSNVLTCGRSSTGSIGTVNSRSYDSVRGSYMHCHQSLSSDCLTVCAVSPCLSAS